MRNLFINRKVTIPKTELRLAFVRSGGPGGQNVNKVATKVELRWAPRESTAFVPADHQWILRRLKRRITAGGDLVVVSNLTRDQSRNRQDALAKLAKIVKTALLRPKPRKKTKPSRGSVERRLGAKKRRSQLKKDRRTP